MTALLRTLLAGGLLLAATGCSVSNNDGPIELTGSIPGGLLEATTTTSSSVPEAVTRDVIVYFLDPRNGTSLVGVPRSVDVGATVQAILSNLFTLRPNGAERPAEAGLVTAIPESAALLSASVVEGSNRLVIDVRGLFGNEGIQGNSLRNALAQIVWTATEQEGVSEVVFRNNGAPVQALIDGGEIAEGPVNRNNYSQSAS